MTSVPKRTPPTTARALFVKWHADFMQVVDARTAHASRHLNQPKDAENEARNSVVQVAKRRLAVQHTRTDWFADWLHELLAAVDDLASAARHHGLDSPAVAKGRQAVEHRARQVPGDPDASIDYQYISVVYRLAPEDSLAEILDHPARISHASGNLSDSLRKAHADLARSEAITKERDRESLVLAHANEHLRLHLGHSIGLLQQLLLEGQATMPAESIDAILGFFTQCNGSSASLPEHAQQTLHDDATTHVVSAAPERPPLFTPAPRTADPESTPLPFPISAEAPTLQAHPKPVASEDAAHYPPAAACNPSTDMAESPSAEESETPIYPIDR